MIFSKFRSYYKFSVFQSGLQSVQKAICLKINCGQLQLPFVTRLKASTMLETICFATESFQNFKSRLLHERRLPLCWMPLSFQKGRLCASLINFLLKNRLGKISNNHFPIFLSSSDKSSDFQNQNKRKKPFQFEDVRLKMKLRI